MEEHREPTATILHRGRLLVQYRTLDKAYRLVLPDDFVAALALREREPSPGDGLLLYLTGHTISIHYLEPPQDQPGYWRRLEEDGDRLRVLLPRAYCNALGVHGGDLLELTFQHRGIRVRPAWRAVYGAHQALLDSPMTRPELADYIGATQEQLREAEERLEFWQESNRQALEKWQALTGRAYSASAAERCKL